MMDFELPEPADDLTELARERLRWNRHSCQGFADAHLPLLTPDEQRPVYEEVSNYYSSKIGFESSINVYVHYDVYDTI